MLREDKLALSDDILMKIEKPERYIGHEVNSVLKNKDANLSTEQFFDLRDWWNDVLHVPYRDL